jgi:hypothetical protein
MKISHMVVSVGMLVMGAVGFTAGCGDSAVFCSFKVATISECFSETPAGDVTSDDISKACTAEGGKTGSSCPTAGLVGDCKITSNGATLDTFYYGGTASVDETGCKAIKGTWTAK